MPTRRRASTPVRRTAREKRDPGATRRALLEAAAVLFAEHGFEGVSVEDVADRARVNKALVSYHFGGKRGLYVAVLESGFSRMADRRSESVRDLAAGAGRAVRVGFRCRS